MRGKFHSDAVELEWCDRRLLARIHRLTINRLRAEIQPVTIAEFQRYLIAWQRVDPEPLVTFAEAVKTRKQAGGNPEAAHRCATILHLANIAIRVGRPIRYDPVKEEIVGDSEALGEKWADLPLSRQRAILTAVLDHAVIKPGRPGLNRFDPSRVKPVWCV